MTNDTPAGLSAQKANAVKNKKYDPGPVILDRALSVLQSYATFYPVETKGLSESSVWLDDIKNAIKAFSHWHYIDGERGDNRFPFFFLLEIFESDRDISA